ncbi:MAG TPA: hypothetical protein VLZ84_12055 [Asticcacaulis sp.]|nr:hypothetical protein [Asticcacaulis sp.]
MKAVVFLVFCICAVLLPPASLAAQTVRSCGPSAIRAAAAKQVAPNLVGCRYDDVAVPLVRYFSIFPVLTKTPDGKANSAILQQSPAAGQPLAAGGQLALTVSVGLSPQPEATKAPAEAVPDVTTVADADISADAAAPVELMTFAPASDAVPAKPEKMPPAVNLFRPALLWIWGGILAVAIAIALVFRGKRKRSEYGYDRVPKVVATLDCDPGKLNAHGPLVVSRGER